MKMIYVIKNIPKFNLKLKNMLNYRVTEMKILINISNVKTDVFKAPQMPYNNLPNKKREILRR